MAVLPVILVDDAQPPPLGSAGNGTKALYSTPALTLASIVGITSITWAIAFKPPGSSAALGSANPTTPFNTTIGLLDKAGTYLINATANGDANSLAQVAITVLTKFRGQRVPAQGEQGDWDPSNWWMPAVQDAVQALDQNRVGVVTDTAFTTDADHSASAAAIGARVIVVKSTLDLTASRTYTIDCTGVTDPWWVLYNATTEDGGGPYGLKVKHTTGNPVLVSAGAARKTIVYFDGTNFFSLSADFIP